MHKTDYNIIAYSSAKSGRVCKVILAPPFIIYTLFSISILVQIPIGYIIHNFSFSLGMLLNQVGTLLVPVLVVIRFFGLTGSEVLPFKRVYVSQVLLAAIMMFSLAVISDYLLYATESILPVPVPLNETYKELMHVDGVWSYIHKLAFLCLMPSFCEEIFFRGFCQTGLGRYYGRAGGILISAAMFAVAHLSFWYVHLYFILGIFLGWLFATSGSLWISIICHIANNFWTFTAHTIGWNMPIKDPQGWWNTPILIGSLVVLLLTMYGWKLLGVRLESE